RKTEVDEHRERPVRRDLQHVDGRVRGQVLCPEVARKTDRRRFDPLMQGTASALAFDDALLKRPARFGNSWPFRLRDGPLPRSNRGFLLPARSFARPFAWDGRTCSRSTPIRRQSRLRKRLPSRPAALAATRTSPS